MELVLWPLFVRIVGYLSWLQLGNKLLLNFLLHEKRGIDSGIVISPRSASVCSPSFSLLAPPLSSLALPLVSLLPLLFKEYWFGGNSWW